MFNRSFNIWTHLHHIGSWIATCESRNQVCFQTLKRVKVENTGVNDSLDLCDKRT